jgi:hypothetical protein
MLDRRVKAGVLGCPNCRDSFPITDGFADLRAPPRRPLEGASAIANANVAAAVNVAADANVAAAHRIVALLGLTQGPATVALAGSVARLAGRVADSIENAQVVAIDEATRFVAERPGVTRMVAAPGLPFLSVRLRGVVVDGSAGAAMIFEAARVTAPLARAVVVNAPDDASTILKEAGLSVLAEEAGTVVAARS